MNNYMSIFIQLLIGVMAILLYKVEARATIKPTKPRIEVSNTREYDRVPVITLVEDDKYDAIEEDSNNLIDVMKKPLTVEQMIKLIEDNEYKLTKTHYYTLQVAYGIEKVPFEVNLKDSLQWVCEQIGLASTINNESYLRLNYAFNNKQLINNL